MGELIHASPMPTVLMWSSRLFFFFSSRRRHTRFDCDWSSDVCSSDLFNANRLDVEHDKVDLIQQAMLNRIVDDRQMTRFHPKARIAANQIIDQRNDQLDRKSVV